MSDIYARAYPSCARAVQNTDDGALRPRAAEECGERECSPALVGARGQRAAATICHARMPPRRQYDVLNADPTVRYLPNPGF